MGLLGGLLGGSSSSTKSTTNQYDQKAAADNGAIALGAGSNLTINDYFPSSVKGTMDNLLSLVSTSQNDAFEASKQALETSIKSNDVLTNAIVDTKAGNPNIYIYVLLGVIIIAVFYFTKGKL